MVSDSFTSLPPGPEASLGPRGFALRHAGGLRGRGAAAGGHEFPRETAAEEPFFHGDGCFLNGDETYLMGNGKNQC